MCEAVGSSSDQEDRPRAAQSDQWVDEAGEQHKHPPCLLGQEVKKKNENEKWCVPHT